jgi:hypothetical protein
MCNVIIFEVNIAIYHKKNSKLKCKYILKINIHIKEKTKYYIKICYQ